MTACRAKQPTLRGSRQPLDRFLLRDRVEFMHIPDGERRRWVAERMEGEAPAVDQGKVFDWLVRAETFEQTLQARYLGTKRFSIEGVAALIPLLEEMLDCAAEHEAAQVVLGMPHRGRLNVMAHVVGVPIADLFAGFEDVDPRSILGGGDVKYHMGATGVFKAGGARGTDTGRALSPLGSLFHQGKGFTNQVIREIEPCLPQLLDQGSRRGHLAADLCAESQP